MLKKILVFILLVLIIGVYTSETVTENTDDVQVNGKKHQKKNVYYTIRKDYRKCATCGGWFLKQVNSADKKEIYVSALNYANSHIPTVNDTNSDQYVVGGFLKKDQFNVMDLTRCLPTVGKKNLNQKYYIYHDGKHDYITELNTHKKVKVGGYLEQFSSNVSNIQKDWLENKIKTDSVLLGAVQGKKNLLEIESVFIRLPDPKKPCKALPLPKCTADHVPAFSRQVDRCLKFEGCVATGICTLSIPVCDIGYSLVSFNSKTGCPKFHCDPEFLNV